MIQCTQSQLIVRDYAVIHSLWFDFEPVDGQHQGLVVPIDQYGLNDNISSLHPNKTLLDIRIGDPISNYQRILKVTKVAIFRATPAPVITSGKPVFEIPSGKEWLERINESRN